MSKNVLILAGSPRIGGNSDFLCDEFKKGAESAGHTVEKINIGKLHIGYCRACYACKKTGKCFQQDDMGELLEKIITADVLVFASPVYFYSIDGQMKTLIDRTLARWTEIKNKDFYYIVTAADSHKAALERSVECFRGFADCFSGIQECGVIYGTGVYEKGTIKGSPAMKEAYQLGTQV